MTLTLLRPLRLTLSLTAILLLAACNPAEMLAPDARLPDGSTYSGDIREGLFQGDGVQQFASGMVYRGQFHEGYWHGQGVLESAMGWRYEGEFLKGLMEGQGVLDNDGTRYEGAFVKGKFSGPGRYEVGDGVYVAEFAEGLPVRGEHITEYGTYAGEFLDWQYHGEGTYNPANAPADMESLSGIWEYGMLAEDNDSTQQQPSARPAPLTEQILVEDRERLNRQIEGLEAERPGVTDVYFLAVGGDGTESVFMRDIEVARAGLQTQFDLERRAIMLLNHRDYETLPLATRPSIATALKALDEQMNPQEDLLVVHLVSHGGEDGDLLLSQPGLELPNLSPQDFAEMIEPLSARRKVLVVSACYSGQWLDELADSDTLILTSARADRTSFGCGDDSEMTWFSKALYKSVGLSLTEPDAMFEQVTEQIRLWEEEIGMDEESWSYPQFHLGDNLRQWLDQDAFSKQ